MDNARIVSLLPATTEILYWLGAGDSVVGVTYECTEPAEAAAHPHVTNTIIPIGATPAEIDDLISKAISAGEQLYTLDTDLLRDLEPSLIVTQDLCRVCALPSGSVVVPFWRFLYWGISILKNEMPVVVRGIHDLDI